MDQPHHDIKTPHSQPRPWLPRAGLLSRANGRSSANVKFMTISRDTRWGIRFGALRQYTQRTGTSLVPVLHVELYEGTNVALGAWVAYNRQQQRAGELSDDRQTQLATLAGWHAEKRRPGRHYDTSRDREIVRLRADGSLIAEIATNYSLSRQRVHQILKKVSPTND